MTERRLSRVLTDRIGRLIWLTLAGYAALLVVLFAALSEVALQRSLEQSADVVQSLIGLYADPAGERTTVAPEMLAERLIGTGEPFLITRATSSGRAGGGRRIYFLSPSLPATQVASPETGASGDAVREQLVRALAERGRWRHAILRRRVGEFDIFVARRRDPYLLALAGLAGAVLLLLPAAALLARRSMTRAVSSGLTPLARVVEETRRIGPQDLSGRIPAPSGIVEVSELSEALNRVRAAKAAASRMARPAGGAIGMGASWGRAGQGPTVGRLPACDGAASGRLQGASADVARSGGGRSPTGPAAPDPRG